MKNKNEFDFDEYDVIDEEDLYMDDDDNNEYSSLVENDKYNDDDSIDINSESEEVHGLIEALKEVDKWLSGARQYLANEAYDHYNAYNVEDDIKLIDDTRRRLYQVAIAMNEIAENYDF